MRQGSPMTLTCAGGRIRLPPTQKAREVPYEVLFQNRIASRPSPGGVKKCRCALPRCGDRGLRHAAECGGATGAASCSDAGATAGVCRFEARATPLQAHPKGCQGYPTGEDRAAIDPVMSFFAARLSDANVEDVAESPHSEMIVSGVISPARSATSIMATPIRTSTRCLPT